MVAGRPYYVTFIFLLSIFRVIDVVVSLDNNNNGVNENSSSSARQQQINFHYLPGVNEEMYSQPGDIMIGAISIVLDEASSSSECSRRPKDSTYMVGTSESIAFAVDLVNRDPNLLPNVTLGFVMRGVCRSSPSVALATSLPFLPRSERVCPRNGNDTESSAECLTQRSALSSDDHKNQWRSHDVVGMVTPGYDILTTMISSLYSVAHLPIVGATEVSDELSDKGNHPYFFRVVPPSRYMVEAMLKFMVTNKWSYVSAVYQEGAHGRKAYENLHGNADRYGICIATSHMLTTSTDYDQVVADLLTYPRARVLVLFVLASKFRKILRAVKNHNATGHFIYVAGDTIVRYSGYFWIGSPNDPGIGTFIFDLYFDYVHAFYDFLEQKIKDIRTSNNPWLRGGYEYLLECDYDVEGDCNTTRPIYGTYRFKTDKAPNLRIDAVRALAHAVHNLLSERCPEARGDEARACVTGELLRQYLKNTTFDGYHNEVEFDENQDVKGKFMISQFVYDHYDYPFTKRNRWKHITLKNFGVYDSSSGEISYLEKPITWSHVNTLDRIIPWTNGSLPIEIPESVCSRPCLIGEYKIEKSVPCCWECLRCRDNERLIDGNTSCKACPIFQWPDPQTGFTTCIAIPPTYPTFDDTIPIILTACAAFFLVLTVATFVAYAIVYRDEKVIKASSRELSVIQLAAIFLGYSTVILFQTKPSHLMCSVIFYLFCMSFALLYCPLLVKTIRIVRIFRSGAKNEPLRFIGQLSQIAFAFCLTAVQVGLNVASYILFQPSARRTQPIWSERLVELSCDLTFVGLVSFLGYNILMVLFCAIFAFMVRKLPDNFNESRFISMCVSTTLLIWLAFVPTYFTADREYVRVFLLSMALILNHTVALALLFAPKIYAAIFLPSDAGNLSQQRS